MSNINKKNRSDITEQNKRQADVLAPFVPTPLDVIDRMLLLAEVTGEDIVYDLGCGDGRIVIKAAKDYAARGVGVDIEPYRVAESKANAKQANVDHLVTFKLQDAMTLDLSQATVVTLYLVHWSTLRILPIIAKKVKTGTRIVSHNFNAGNWQPSKVESFIDENGNDHALYLWIVDKSINL